MKKISIMILVLVAAMASCKKTPEVNLKYVDVERDLVTVGMTTANIQCDYAYIATLKKAYLFYGEVEDETNMTSAEMRVVQNTLYVELTGLKENTTYSYYYEFHNGFHSMRTALKSFMTDASGGGDEPPTPSSIVPEGAIGGLFSVSPTLKVYISQGNLQYQASTNTWRFAEQQWNYVGGIDYALGTEFGNVFVNGTKCNNSFVSDEYDGWIDLFGFGTNGVDNGFPCYQPWSISTHTEDYYCYNLDEGSGNADWGYNAIVNGGNQIGLWRTLKPEEWKYMMNSRSTVSGIRFALACLDGTNGLIIFPDDWESSFYDLNNYNGLNSIGVTFYTNNIISIEDWNSIIEPHGAVFLPAAGDRAGNAYSNSTNSSSYIYIGSYFSSNVMGDFSNCFSFMDNWIDIGSWSGKYVAHSVRLVHDANH